MLAGVGRTAVPASAAEMTDDELRWEGKAGARLFPGPRAGEPRDETWLRLCPPLRTPRSLPLTGTWDLGETFSDLLCAGTEYFGSTRQAPQRFTPAEGQSAGGCVHERGPERHTLTHTHSHARTHAGPPGRAARACPDLHPPGPLPPGSCARCPAPPTREPEWDRQRRQGLPVTPPQLFRIPPPRARPGKGVKVRGARGSYRSGGRVCARERRRVPPRHVGRPAGDAAGGRLERDGAGWPRGPALRGQSPPGPRPCGPGRGPVPARSAAEVSGHPLTQAAGLEDGGVGRISDQASGTWFFRNFVPPGELEGRPPSPGADLGLSWFPFLPLKAARNCAVKPGRGCLGSARVFDPTPPPPPPTPRMVL